MPIPTTPLVPLAACARMTGVFFVRRCPRSAVAQCARCGQPTCEEHLRDEGELAAICVGCVPAARRRLVDDGDAVLVATATASAGGDTSTASATESWSDVGGGEFGGAGATGGWEESGAATAPSDSGFSPQDYAAFDAMAAADARSGPTGYDS
jgi:hypothetical protein